MVLSVPPPLVELGSSAAERAREELAIWQGELWWCAAQWLRAAVEPAPIASRWMGTVAQLESVIGGSVVLGGGDADPAIVPLSTDTTPAVKGSPSGPLIRLEGHPGQSGRYVAFQVVIGSSEGVWPAPSGLDEVLGEMDARCGKY
ncbi:hypothetical protein AB1Y20_012246 [Prymnesium parvum]|uniref:Uncharacterized protein n=1 Tax=Prymnesium parvum TaxID=97485 RepID=A0AB34IQC8_PRYPA